jgi:phenylpropionate dioxygenase-like ring-hydroxylating dioxygenase large terminal subunit
MLTREENEMLTRTGSGTPMGDLFRRFWVPVILPDELAALDGPPVRVRVLGERLVAFRDTQGRAGLLDARCPHRGADLGAGFAEEGGLRCGLCLWKFDVGGNCLEIPLEPPESTLKSQVHAASHLLEEWGGLLWAYLGPQEMRPEQPSFEWARLPESHRYISRYLVECNYMQAVEGGIDAGRVAFLQSLLSLEPAQSGSTAQATAEEPFKIVVRYADYGCLIGARREGKQGRDRWQITQWLMPFYTTAPVQRGGLQGSLAWVPMDDESTMAFAITYHPTRPLTPAELARCRQGAGLHPQVIRGAHQRKRNRGNRYLAEGGEHTANPLALMRGVLERTLAIQESLGPIADRSQENLAPNDVAVFAARDRLLKAAIELREGVEPPAARRGDVYRVRAGNAVIKRGAAFDETAEIVALAHPSKGQG